ncbi:MAG TPA: hypothetical protein VFH47_07155, partial [Candidatus Thermoplasmatota archaeon]|nr:hypothetical protein [Candidatus Thermoplasmatota archaeon]
METDFDPAHHCDRDRGMSDEEAFAATASYVHAQKQYAVRSAQDRETLVALRAMGRALHALQDCFSHTNVLDLGDGVARETTRALLENGSMPPGLRLVGIDSHSSEVGAPDGDPYPHDRHNKDAPDGSPEAGERLPDGRTRHEAAHALAVEATAAFLEAVKREAGEEAWTALAAA